MSTLVLVALLLFYLLFVVGLVLGIKRFVDYVKRDEE